MIEREKGPTSGAVDDTSAKTAPAFDHAKRVRAILFRSHRDLRKFLVPIIASRMIWSIAVTLRSGPSAAAAVLRGLGGGIAWKRKAQ